MDEKHEELLRTASAVSSTARLAAIAHLEARKRAREAMVRAVQGGCSQTAVAKAVGVTKQRVKQVLDQEAKRKDMDEEDYDKLIMSFPPAGLTSRELIAWTEGQEPEVNEDGDRPRAVSDRR